MDHLITLNSKIYLLVDIIPGIIIHTLFLLIPLHMFRIVYVDLATCCSLK